jgi:hypothetical protein
MVGLLALAHERAGEAEIAGSLTRNSDCPISINLARHAASHPILP